MATVVIGDVHGELRALDNLLSRLDALLAAGDTVVFLGDYIDRGPDTRGCIDRILWLQRESPATVVSLLGNHEDWLLRSIDDPTRHDWLIGMEAHETIASYSPRAAEELHLALQAAGPRLLMERIALPYGLLTDAMPPGHLDFLRGLRLYYETGDAVCVHGGLDPAVPNLEDQPRNTLLWGTEDFRDAYSGAKIVVYGHRRAALDGQGRPSPRRRGQTVGIDTIGYGVLTALWLPEMRVIQSAPAQFDA